MINIRKACSAVTAVALCITLMAGCGKGAENAATEVGADTTTPAAEVVSSDSAFINSDWTYGQVSVGGGGFVTGIISTCEKDVFYARTDVGGAYRWDGASQKWQSVSCNISEDDVGLLGIDGIAADPNNAANLYLLAGTDYFSNGKTALLKSTDYGKTFTETDLSDIIRVHGNGMGRGNGERIAVDPDNSSVIYIGGRTGGLIRSTDGGATFAKVESFPVGSTKNANGINGILFDSAAKKIYVSVSQKDTDEGNLFVSADAGESWTKVENAHNEDMPQRMKLDSKGNLYVTYANNEGPWNASTGAVYRYGSDGSATNIAPSAQSFGDIVIDPTNDDRLVLVTTEMWTKQPNGSFGDIFYTSVDGGKSWTNLLDTMTMSNNGMSWISDCAIHWCSSLMIDPNNSNRVMVNSGNGIFACDNIWDASPEFYFNAQGLEETVPLDIISLKDYPLISAAGDYDGFVHSDINVPAERHSDKIGTTSSISIAAKNKDIWAKVGGDEQNQKLNYSTDGGKTWNSITTSPESGKKLYQGHVAFNADGSRLIWSSSNWLKAYYTEDFGKTWAICEGLTGQDIYLIGDPENSNYVYACGGGSAYASADGGKSFTKLTSPELGNNRLCVIPGEEGSFYAAGGAGLYKFTEYGAKSELIAGPVHCAAVGIGKGRTDSDPYVIYIWGDTKDSSVKGIYMSEDSGASWSRVDDDLHRFGGLGNGHFICGDMNVYGRVYMSTVGLGIAYCDKNEK